MAWLVADDRVLATANIAESCAARVRGVLGSDGLDGVLVLRPARSVHTFGVRFALDVCYCAVSDDHAGDENLRVLDIVTMVPNRLGRPRFRSGVVIEAPKGSFERWGVNVGDRLKLRE